MSDPLPPFDESELTEEDRKILREFEMREQWNTKSLPTTSHVASYVSQDAQEVLSPSHDEILIVFSSEVTEDIALIRRMLEQLEQEDHIQIARLSGLAKPTHKIRGTAGAMNCQRMAHIAHIMEILIAQAQQGLICPARCVRAMAHAVNALEEMLRQFSAYGEERDEPYALFEAELLRLAPDFSEQLPKLSPSVVAPQAAAGPVHSTAAAAQVPKAPHARMESAHSESTIAVDAQRIEQLALHIEALAELRTPLEHAEEEVEQALRELHLAQARLHELEEMLRLVTTKPEPVQSYAQSHPTSSLMARILSEASQSQPHPVPRKIRPRTRLMRACGAMAWEKQEQELEQQQLLRAIKDAVTDVDLASARVSSAFLGVRVQTRRHVTQAMTARNSILALRSAPLRILIEAIRQEIDRSQFAQAEPIRFEIAGEATEIGQDILEELKAPLLQLVHTCIADTLDVRPRLAVRFGEPRRIWVHVQGFGNEAVIEIGFSMMVQGGAIDAVRSSLRHLHSTITSQRNATGGISFYIRLPRSRGAVRCLQVRVGEQHIIVPFAQVQCIGTRAEQDEQTFCLTLGELLAIPTQKQGRPRIQPTLILLQHGSHLVMSVAVDEVEREVELLVRPLAPHLQRPGITGAAIDGNSNVLLMVDLPELVRHYTSLHRTTTGARLAGLPPQPPWPRQPIILIADDSIAIRQSLLAQLAQQNYSVREAQDGIDALEKLVEQVPDVFILDLDMPNLSGFDLLNIMRLYPELAHVKVVMLTSRDSERDRRHAFELGAHMYLTKQNRQEPLVETIQQLLLQA